ncbi:MAG: hypothetical protein OQJ91_09815 [Motiliproteus sp.]|nr:hypothetical protein [Motiliproteus sp.]
MQIGPAVNFNQSLGRPAVQPAAGFRPSPQQPDSQPQSQQQGVAATAVIDDLIQAAEQSSQAREQANFYSMERELPFKGQEALNAYLTTSQFRSQADNSQLVGVDIYI